MDKNKKNNQNKNKPQAPKPDCGDSCNVQEENK